MFTSTIALVLATSPSSRSLLENGVMLVLTCDSASWGMAAI